MGIANIVNTAGGGGGSSEIITHLVNSVDGAGLKLANQGYISCADVSANRFGTNDFSVEFVLSQETNAINADIFISNFNSSNQAVDAAVIRWDVIQNDNIQLVFTNSSATETAYNFGYDPAPDLNEPTHYLVSADRSGNAVLYRNGAEIASVSIAASSSANVGNSGQPTVIGSPVNNFGVKGNVYRFRTYSKALSSDEAKNVFDRADVPTALVSNLLLDLDCAYANPTQSTVIQDRGPNNQDGTLNGTITQTNVIKQLNSTSARIGTSAATPADGELLVSGNLGVGCDPDTKLEVNGDAIWLGNAANNASGRILFNENTNPNGTNGFSLLYSGSPNPTLDGTTFTAAANSFNILRHNSSTAGAVVMSIERTSGAVSIGSGTAAVTTTKPSLLVTDTSAGGSVTIRGLSPVLAFDITSSGTGTILTDGGGLNVKDGNLDSHGNTLLAIDSTGNITTASDGIALKLDGTSNTTRGIFIRNTGGSAHGYLHTDGNLKIIAEDSGKSISFYTANDGSGTARLTIGSTGLCTFSAGVNLGNTASATATTLDGYEEGTWTCQLNGVTGTHTGYYTRTGNVVQWMVKTAFNTATAVAATFSGLPFTVANEHSPFVVTHNTWATTAENGYVERNSTGGKLIVANSTSVATAGASSSFRYCYMGGVYQTTDAF